MEIALAILVIGLVALFALSPSSRAATFNTLLRVLFPHAPQPARVPNTGNLASPSERADKRAFEDEMEELATQSSPSAYREMTQRLRESEPESHREIAIAVLRNALPQVVPILLEALNDRDKGVRAGAARVLGLRGESSAMGNLAAATRDPSARVRRAAITSLGELYAWQVLPRLERLQVIDRDADARQSAVSAIAIIKRRAANEMGVAEDQVIAISVMPADPPRFYVATRSDLYTRRGATWERVSQLPDVPLALATGADEQRLYLSTESAGLYRSSDGGTTWEYLEFGLNTPTHITVITLVVDPQNSQQVYAQLATPAATPGKLDPLGVSASFDEGKTWYGLDNSPMQGLTSQLVVDPELPGYLFGMMNDTPWRYDLRSNMLMPFSN